MNPEENVTAKTPKIAPEFHVVVIQQSIYMYVSLSLKPVAHQEIANKRVTLWIQHEVTWITHEQERDNSAKWVRRCHVENTFLQCFQQLCVGMSLATENEV